MYPASIVKFRPEVKRYNNLKEPNRTTYINTSFDFLYFFTIGFSLLIHTVGSYGRFSDNDFTFWKIP